MYKKNKLQFLLKKLYHYSKVVVEGDYLCFDKKYTLKINDLSDWLLYAIGHKPEDFSPENLNINYEVLNFKVWFDGKKFTEISISKLFESYGCFRFLARMASGNEGVCSAPWLWYGLDYERGGYVEYDFEHAIGEKNKIHCANHLGFWYDKSFHKFSQKRNTLYKPSFFPTEEFYWYMFKVYPDRIEKWINNICVNVIQTHGQPDSLYAVFSCGTGGIAKGDPKNNILPVQATLKAFEFIPFRR